MLARHLIPALVVIAALFNCNRLGSKLGPPERASYKVVTNPPLATMSPKLIDMLLLGHGSLYDDFISIWAIQILAEPNIKNLTTAEDLNQTLLTLMKHLPRIEGLYILSCYVLALDFHRPELCERFAVEGLKAFPNSWRIPMSQGFVAAFEMKNDLQAAAYYQLAASRPNSPEYVGKLATRLTTRGYADGQDLNESVQLMMEVPGGSRIVDILRERLKNQTPPQRSGDEQ